MDYGAKIIFNMYRILTSIHGTKQYKYSGSLRTSYDIAVKQLHGTNRIDISMSYSDAAKLKSYNDAVFNGYTPADIFIGYFIFIECNRITLASATVPIFLNTPRLNKILYFNLEDKKRKLYNQILENEKFIKTFMGLEYDQQDQICDIMAIEQMKLV
jgi:hypothetical protein